jgi:type VI secretion system protein
MALRLEIVSQHRKALGERGLKEFGHDGGTIGRSLESDWVLPDAQRYLSSRHACIDFRSGSYYIVDTSMNGVFVNGGRKPVGRGKPQRLFSGDRLRIGEYEMLVQIDEADDSLGPLPDTGHRDPVDLAQRVPPPEPTGDDLVDPFEMTGVGFEEFVIDDSENNLKTMPHGEIEWILDQEEAAGNSVDAPPAEPLRLEDEPSGQAELSARPVSTEAGKPQASTPEATDEAEPVKTEAASNRPSRSGAPAALDAFLRGAGLDQQSVTDDEALRTLHRVGQLMRELIVGITESLHVRAEQKNSLRLPNTTIQPRNNNPLKFSAGVEEALHNLFFRQTGEYLSSVDAVREALRDIKTHQQIMLAALPAAMNEYINLLDPDELEQKFSGSARRSALLGAASKFKYWDLYKDMYQVVAQRAPGQLPAQFVEELARAYELESERRSARGSEPARVRAV